jgi:hypothetical protein
MFLDKIYCDKICLFLSGLFPAPLPQDSETCARAARLFWFLGIFLAKTLLDNRLVDLPLSHSFLKLLCGGEVSASVKEKSTIVREDQHEDELMASSMYSVLSVESDVDAVAGSIAGSVSGGRPTSQWYTRLLSIDDLVQVMVAYLQFLMFSAHIQRHFVL